VLTRLRPAWVATAAGVKEVADACRAAGRFALDTEADSLHSYFHKVCLIQVSAGDRHFLIDPLALGRDGLGPLLEVVADPHIPVLMHGADYDVRVLDRDYGARIRGLEDTQIMAHLLGEPRTGLAVLLENELGISQDKKYQRADWGRRPIPDEMLAYAAVDTAFLEPLNARLRARLEALGRWSWAVEEFRRLENVRFAANEKDPLAFERVKGVRALGGVARDRAYTLFEWRDEAARRLNIPPFKVLGNRQLLDLAADPPPDLGELAKRPGLGPRFVRRWGREVAARLARPARAPARRRREPGIQLGPAGRRRLKALRAARDGAAKRLGLEPGLVCPKAVLEALAGCGAAPRSAADLAGCGLSGWRLECLGGDFLAALARAEAGGEDDEEG